MLKFIIHGVDRIIRYNRLTYEVEYNLLIVLVHQDAILTKLLAITLHKLNTYSIVLRCYYDAVLIPY